MLRSFVESRSQQAFAELLHRHLPAVYAHARRLLRDPHRAEDITQAVFLLLAQSAPTLNPNTPLIGWLHQVTHFTCRNAQRIDARRKHHEQEAARMLPQTAPPPDADLEPHIDHILHQLPAHERDTLLLRFVHNHSLEQIARLTHVSEAAAKKRLHRGLQKLRTRFATRGIELPASFAPTLLAAKAAPAHLFSAALATSLTPTPALAQLAHATTTTLLAAKLKIAAALLLAATLLTGISTFLLNNHSSPTAPVTFMAAPPPTPAAPIPTPPAQSDRLFTVHGIVLDPQNHPVPNAIITVPAPSNWYTRLTCEVIAKTTTTPDGRFQISYHKSQVAPFSAGGGTPGDGFWKSTMIVAHANGFGMAWCFWDHTNAAGDLTLQLAPDDIPIQGRILTPDGKPAANVPIIIEGLVRVRGKELENLYAKDPHLAEEASLGLPLDSAGIHEPIFTDANGRFRVTGLGRHRYVALLIHGLSVAFDRIDAATKNMPPETQIIQQPRGTSDTYITYGATFDFTARPAISVQGTIRDASTGKPVAGIKVRSYRFPGKFLLMDPEGLLATVTDPNGHYSLDGFPKGKGNELIIVPAEDQPYFIRKMKVDDDPTQTLFTVDADIDKGIIVTGRVTDKTTGRPVCCRMAYTTEKMNEHTWDLPEFSRRDGFAEQDDEPIFHETKPDGTYRLVAAPGTAIISAQCWNDHYIRRVGAENIPIMAQKNYVLKLYEPCFLDFANAITQIDIPENATSATADLQLESGTSIQVSLVDPDGKPIPNCFIRGDDAENYGGWWGHIIPTATFTATSLTPSEPRVIVAINHDRQLAKVATFHLADIKNNALTIKLQPLATITGRCVDPNGKPLPNLILEAAVGGKDLPEVTTDANGQFSYPIITGSDCYIRVSRGHYVGATVLDTFQPSPREIHALGDVIISAQEP